MLASQAAMQVAGNNMANAATVGFHRQSIHLGPTQGSTVGRNVQVGMGVQILAVRREVDVALQSRYRDAISQYHRDVIDQRFLSTIESLQNELTDNDLSSLLSVFFNSFSELANNPSDNAMRSTVIQQGRNLASRIASMRSDYNVVLDEVDRSLGNTVAAANDLLDRIAQINHQISVSEGGGGQANALRDQRDLLIDQLAEYIDMNTVEQANGSVDVFVGSVPVVLNSVSRGLELRTVSDGGQTKVQLRVAADGTHLEAHAGSIGGLLRQREETIRPVIHQIDEFANQLIFQVNRLHSQGQAREGFSSISGAYAVEDLSANLNASAAGLPFRIENGSFFIHVTHAQTGVRTSHQINVSGNEMSLNDLIHEINTAVGVPNVQAGVSAANTLTLNASAGYEISFSDDTSGALAALGINTFFTGSNAADIDVSQILRDNPNMLAVGHGHVPGSNGIALAIADLQDTRLDGLDGRSLREYWQQSVNALAVRTGAANAAVQSSALVKESLSAQVQSVAGVSLDEEAINLMTFQRQFQAAARFISVIDETLQTLMSIA